MPILNLIIRLLVVSLIKQTFDYCRTFHAHPKFNHSQKLANTLYFFHNFKTASTFFIISYITDTRPVHEFITAPPNGIKFRKKTFESVRSLINWFKREFMNKNRKNLLKKFRFDNNTSLSQISIGSVERCLLDV